MAMVITRIEVYDPDKGELWFRLEAPEVGFIALTGNLMKDSLQLQDLENSVREACSILCGDERVVNNLDIQFPELA